MVLKIGYVDGRLVAYDPTDYPASRYPTTYTPTKYGTHISTTPTQDWKPSGTEVMTETGGMTLTPEAYKKHQAEQQKKETLRQARATFAPSTTPAYYPSRATLTTPESVKREGLDWSSLESGAIKPPIEFRQIQRRDYPSEAAYLGARAMRSATSGILSPVNLPFYVAEAGRRWYKAGEHAPEYIRTTAIMTATGLARTAREDPLGLAADIGGGILGGIAVTGTISDIKASFFKPKIIDVGGRSTSKVTPLGKGTIGKTKAVYASKVGKKDIGTTVDSRFMTIPTKTKKTGIVSSGKAETFIKEKSFFGAERIKTFKAEVGTAGVATKLKGGDVSGIFTSMTKTGKELKGYFGAGIRRLQAKLGDKSLFDTSTFLKDLKDKDILAKVHTEDIVTQVKPPVDIFKPDIYKSISQRHRPLDILSVVDVGVKAHVDVVKAVSESARPSLIPLGAISLKPKSKPVKATTSLITPAISFEKQRTLELSDLSKSMVAPVKTRQITKQTPKQLESQLFKQFSGFVSRQAQSQITLPVQSQLTLTAQKQATRQRQLQKTVQIVETAKPSMSLPSLVTPFSMPNMIPPISSIGIKKTHQAPRPRKIRKLKGKRRFELIPRADWLSVTITEASLFEKARHPRRTRETRAMFKRRLSTSLATLRFPTAQQLRRKKKKRRKKKRKRR